MTCDAEQAARIAALTADLTWITESWPDLYQLRLPGSRRRAPRRPMSRSARERADELARTEKAEQGLSVLGAGRAPMNVGVLDALARLLADAVELDEYVTATAGVVDDVAPPSTAYDFEAIGRVLAHTAAHLSLSAAADAGVLGEAEAAVKRMRSALEGALEDVVDGYMLSTVCAWCHGATSTAPAGGEQTLVVKVVAGQPLIVCRGEWCEPPPEDCGTWLFGRPAWRDAEWEWLARRLAPGNAEARAASGTSPEEAVRQLLEALREEPEEVPSVLGGLLGRVESGGAA